MKNQEVWLPVKGYEGHYEVSNLGRVKSIKKGSYKILKKCIDNSGYYIISLCINSVRKTRTVHQLVAIAFLNHIPDGCINIIDHIDNNPKNNNVDNLQVTTVRNNTSKDKKNGTSKYIGVSWHKPLSKWRTSIRVNKKRKHLGYFLTEKVAAAVYQYELNKLNN